MFQDKYAISPKLLPVGTKRRSGRMLGPVKFIVAHDTGNPGSTARMNVNYYTSTANNESASAHLFVDDKEILECIPALLSRPEKAWHVLYNKPKDNELYGADANDAAIGVEYCYGSGIDADKAYAKYVWLLAKLCYEFKLDPATSVVGHCILDPTRKTDPATGLMQSRRSYDRLLKDIVTEYNDCTGQGTAPVYTETPLSADATTLVKLNLRSGPSTRANLVQSLGAHTPLKLVARIDNGEPVNNNRVWFKDSNGNYCWSGGVQLATAPQPAVKPVPAAQPPIAVQPASAPASGGAPLVSYKPDQKCLDFIKAHEGYKLSAYQDSAGIWTIGYGSILYEDNSKVKPGDQITPDRADALLAMEVEEKSETVKRMIQNPNINQNQFDALVSFAYNVGTDALRNSTLLRRVNANPADPSIREAFLMWNKAHVDGQLVEIQGLTKRRGDEADLYFS